MTGDVLARIRQLPEDKRRQLAARLRGTEPVDAVDAAARFEPFPLGRTQRAYLAGAVPGRAFSRGTGLVYSELEVTGPVDDLESRLNRAIRRLVERHDMLRITFANGRQRVRSQVDVPTIQLGQPSDRWNTDRCREKAHRATFDLEGDDLPLRVWAFREAVDRVVVCVLISALVTDGTSRFRLGWELHLLLENPDATLPEPPLTYRDCVLALRTEHASDAWRRRLEQMPAPLPAFPAPSRSHLCHSVEPVLSAPAWKALKSAASQTNIGATSLTTVLLCDALAAETGVRQFSFAMMSSYRPQIHDRVNEVVGNFNTSMPVSYQFVDPSSLVDRARTLQAQLGWMLDHQDALGLSYLRRLATRHGRSQRRPASELLINSVFDYSVKTQWRLARIEDTARYHIRERAYWFAIPSVALLPTLAEDDDGQLLLCFAYERDLLDLVRSLGRRFAMDLGALAASDDAWHEPWTWRRLHGREGDER